MLKKRQEGCTISMNGHESDYHTLKGYEMAENCSITFAMEDYLEMICRLSDEIGSAVRIKQLADGLNVTPSAVSKMADNLRSLELINYERYGSITLTDKGRLLGHTLIARHRIINRFLCFINGTESELEETEKIEHYLSPRTISNIEKFLDNIKHDQRV